MVLKIPEEVLKGEEVAALLRVAEDIIVKEANSGALPSFKVGGELRFLKQDIEDYVERARQHGGSVTRNSGRAVERKGLELKLSPGKPFSYVWPHKKTQTDEDSTEDFEKVMEGTARLNGDLKRVKVGYTWRKSAGMKRRRAVIWVENRPLVEFAGGNDFERTKSMASIIRNDRKQIKTMEAVPSGYDGLQIDHYDEIVRGPRAPRCLAVICKADDFDAMVKHALLRLQGIEAGAKTTKKEG
jgi:excisionase family DNA binding protein